MVNEFNIKIFDFIFSINIGLQGNYLENENNDVLCAQLSKLINDICNEYDFWNEHKHFFNDNCVIDASTLDGYQYIYNGFPRMKLATKKLYLNYKLEQLKNSISNEGEFLQEKFEEMTENIINVGRKEILDYCNEVGIIKYIGKVFLAADNCPACAIIYDNIKAVLYTEEEVQSLMAENIILVNGDGNSFGNIEQNVGSNNYDDKMFELVLNKLDLLKQEGVAESDLKSLEEACKSKNKEKVVSFLKNITTGTISSVVAAGILCFLGIR